MCLKNYFQYKLITFSFLIWTQGDTLLLVHSEWSFGRNRIAYFVCETWKINNVKCIWLFITKIEKTSVLLLVAMNSQAHWARANTFYMIHNSNINTAIWFYKICSCFDAAIGFQGLYIWGVKIFFLFILSNIRFLRGNIFSVSFS